MDVQRFIDACNDLVLLDFLLNDYAWILVIVLWFVIPYIIFKRTLGIESKISTVLKKRVFMVPSELCFVLGVLLVFYIHSVDKRVDMASFYMQAVVDDIFSDIVKREVPFGQIDLIGNEISSLTNHLVLTDVVYEGETYKNVNVYVADVSTMPSGILIKVTPDMKDAYFGSNDIYSDSLVSIYRAVSYKALAVHYESLINNKAVFTYNWVYNTDFVLNINTGLKTIDSFYKKEGY